MSISDARPPEVTRVWVHFCALGDLWWICGLEFGLRSIHTTGDLELKNFLRLTPRKVGDNIFTITLALACSSFFNKQYT